MSDLTAAEAHRLFLYDPESGALTRRISTGANGIAGRQCNAITGEGYYHLKLNGKSYLVHRIIWLMMTGAFPTMTIDHVNRVRHDNRWSNLRLADKRQQNGNAKTRKSKSGIRGVRQQGTGFQARIKMKCPEDGKFRMRGLGTFPTAEQAKAAYDAAASQYFGEFYQPSLRSALEAKP